MSALTALVAVSTGGTRTAAVLPKVAIKPLSGFIACGTMGLQTSLFGLVSKRSICREVLLNHPSRFIIDRKDNFGVTRYRPAFYHGAYITSQRAATNETHL
jgi:hypothetical protein